MTYQPYDDQVAKEIVASYEARPEMLVQILHRFIERFGWISDDAIWQLADELNLSRADVHGVVSYYHDFRTKPPRKNIVKVCEAEACQAMGGRELSAHASTKLAERDVTLEPVYCLGNCACSPAIMVNGKTYGRVSKSRFDDIVESLGDEV